MARSLNPIKSQKVDIAHLRHLLSKHMDRKTYYEDSQKTKEENIELIIERAVKASLDLDTFLSDVTENLRNRHLRKFLIRYLISVKFNVDLFYTSKARSYVDEVLDGCVLIQCQPSESTMLVTIDGKIKIEEYQYWFRRVNKFILARRIIKNQLTQQQQLQLELYPAYIRNKVLYRQSGVGLFSSSGNEIIPCCFETIGFGDYPDCAKIWHNNIGYLLYPISGLSAIQDKDILRKRYCTSEWIIRDSGNAMYRLSLSDCYLFDWSMIGPNRYVSFKDVNLVLDSTYSRPDIYNLDEYAYRERMKSYSQKDIIKLLTRIANEVTTMIGEKHIMPKEELETSIIKFSDGKD